MWTLGQIAKHVGGIVAGDESFQVDSVGTLQSARINQLSFLANTKYRKYLAVTKAGVVIVNKATLADVPNHAIIVDDPYVAYAKAATLLNIVKQHQTGIHASASISPDSRIHSSVSIGAQAVIESGVELAENVIVGPGCVIQSGVNVGAETQLIANITLCDAVQIGKRVLIHPGVVIGADGFGIANDNGNWIKVPQLGSVEIGNDVEIGANTTIDRGALEDTIIGNGVKLDNQIQIGHNVIIGENTVIAGCAGIAGSTRIGKNCVIGGAVVIAGHIEIAEGVQLMGSTAVSKSIKESGVYASGIPAEPSQKWRRNVVHFRQLDKLVDRVKQLESLKNMNSE